jgi:hypothetical protein
VEPDPDPGKFLIEKWEKLKKKLENYVLKILYLLSDILRKSEP